MVIGSLDGRVLVDVTNDPVGDVGSNTRFEYHQDGDLIWARYSGGAVRLGYLVGTRNSDSLDFRYTHVTTDGIMASGHCQSELRFGEDGQIESHERWKWTSKSGSGTSVIREVCE